MKSYIEGIVIKEAQNQQTQFEKNICSLSLNSHLLKLNNLNENFSEISELQKIKVEVKKKLSNEFQTRITTLITYFKSNIETDYNKQKMTNFLSLDYSRFSLNAEIAFKALEYLNDFIIFRINNKKIIFEYIDKFDFSIGEVFTEILKFLNQIQKHFDLAFFPEKIIDINLVLLILNQVQLLDPLIGEIKNKFKIYKGTDISQFESFITAFDNTKMYAELFNTVADCLHKIRSEIINIELINNETIRLQKERDNFYNKLNLKIEIINKVKNFKNHLISETIEKECKESLKEKIKDLELKIDDILENFLSDKNQCNEFFVNFINLETFSKVVDTKFFKLEVKVNKIQEKLINKVIDISEELLAKTNIEDVVKCLIEMKLISNTIYSFKEKIDTIIKNSLKNYLNKNKKSQNIIPKIGQLLDKDPIGKSLLSELEVFDGFNTSIFNTKTNIHKIDYVLDNIKGHNLDKEILKKIYIEFDIKYQEIVKKFLNPDGIIDYDTFNSNFLSFLKEEYKQTRKNINWKIEIRDKIPTIIAYIFAFWTLRSSGSFYNISDENRNSYLKQPHSAQVISIFRIMGIGYENEKLLMNNLVQIGTGEGKSITMAVTATTLACLGFDITCACYSSYLSDRDYQSFKDIFSNFRVEEHIKYGTFDKLCENFINKDGDIRGNIKNMIIKKGVEIKKITEDRANILIIDEVDVFFSEDFYGNMYNPVGSIQDKTINSLINFIWSGRATINLEKIKLSKEFNDCLRAFPGWEFIIEESVIDMLKGVKSFESHDYIVKEDKIGYKEQDSIVFNISYGYKTLFAYYKEKENNKISQSSLNDNISIKIKCGNFSYAELPKEFDFIMGVTGTLDTLSELEKKVVETKYKINRNTYIPSVFGKNNMKFNKKRDILISNSRHDYFNNICSSIASWRETNLDIYRPVFVFFESEKELMEFKKNDCFKDYLMECSILTEEASPSEKNKIVQDASNAGKITLFTKVFGRGTDFVVRDPKVSKMGGIHVIQTFLSKEISEEIQIKGRTARQGEQGSFSMILFENHLVKYKINQAEIESNEGDLYELLNSKRNQIFKCENEENKKKVENACEIHNKSIEILKAIRGKNSEELKSKLKSFYL